MRGGRLIQGPFRRRVGFPFSLAQRYPKESSNLLASSLACLQKISARQATDRIPTRSATSMQTAQGNS